MNIKKERIASLVLFALLLLSFPAISTPVVKGSPSYPPLPMLKLVITGNTVEVWLMGEGETNLDPYWDIMGLDIRLHFKPSAVQALLVKADPNNWFKAFWPFGIVKFAETKDNVNGIARVAFVGFPGAGGVHTPPNGQGRVMKVDFNAPPAEEEIYLLNPLPRPHIDPWGPEYFLVDVAGFPHSDRPEAPWNGNSWSPAIPHVVVPSYVPPLAFIDVSRRTPNVEQPVDFDASRSIDPDGTIVSYEWDFGDGTTGTDVIMRHSFAERGFYLVTLTIIDDDGLTSVASIIIPVKVLQWAKPEHHVYRVSTDEDEHNSLTARVLNYGGTAAVVTAAFKTYDKRTGTMIAPTLTMTSTIPVGGYTDLTAGWNPTTYGWLGGRDSYEVIAELLLEDGTKADADKILFTVAP